jgi:hypothetical protein
MNARVKAKNNEPIVMMLYPKAMLVSVTESALSVINSRISLDVTITKKTINRYLKDVLQ